MFHIFQAGGGWLMLLLLLTCPLRGPYTPARPHLLDVDSPSPPGNVIPESSGSWWCDYCELARMAFAIGEQEGAQNTIIWFVLTFVSALGRENTAFWKKGASPGSGMRGSGTEEQPGRATETPSTWAQRLGLHRAPSTWVVCGLGQSGLTAWGLWGSSPPFGAPPYPAPSLLHKAPPMAGLPQPLAGLLLLPSLLGRAPLMAELLLLGSGPLSSAAV